MNEELDLKQILKYSYQRKAICATILVLSLIIGMIYTFLIKKPTYEVTSKILIDKADASIEQVVKSKELIKDNLTAEFNKTSKIVDITTKMNDKENALNTTNKYIEELQIKLQEIYGIKSFQIIEKPELPQTPNNIDYSKDLLVALTIGCILCIIYIMFSLNFSGLTNIFDIEEKIKIKALGNVNLDNNKKKNQEIYVTKNEKILNQLKRVQVNIMLNKENKNPQTILLTGTKAGEGKTYIASNLAIQFSKLYSKILVIDANIKDKTLTNIMNKNGEEGLTELVQTNNIEDIKNLIQNTKTENISILPAGNIKIGEEKFLTSTISNILEELKKTYDIILIDSASINEDVLPIYLTSIVDETAIIAESGKVKQEDIIKAKTQIENVGGKIAGIILNKAY